MKTTGDVEVSSMPTTTSQRTTTMTTMPVREVLAEVVEDRCDFKTKSQTTTTTRTMRTIGGEEIVENQFVFKTKSPALTMTRTTRLLDRRGDVEVATEIENRQQILDIKIVQQTDNVHFK